MRFILLFFILFGILSAEKERPGSVIVLNVRGNAVSVMPNGQHFDKKIERGNILSEGLTLKTSNFAEVLLLFSNGTTVTLDQNSELIISRFKQSPFDGNEQKLGDAISEPSSSNTLLDLKIGKLIAKTKKLSKGSNFSISTSAGTAGIIRERNFKSPLIQMGSSTLMYPNLWLNLHHWDKIYP